MLRRPGKGRLRQTGGQIASGEPADCQLPPALQQEPVTRIEENDFRRETASAPTSVARGAANKAAAPRG